jgi:hypothetical protein
MMRNVESSESEDDYAVLPDMPPEDRDPEQDSTPHPHNTRQRKSASLGGPGRNHHSIPELTLARSSGKVDPG